MDYDVIPGNDRAIKYRVVARDIGGGEIDERPSTRPCCIAEEKASMFQAGGYQRGG